MNAEESIDKFLELRAKYPNGYAMWHCRIATHGLKNVDNCHPFQVGGSPLTYLGHNGVLSVTPGKGDTRSDTAIFAQEILPTIGGVTALDNPFLVHLLEKWMLGSKMVILTVDPAAKKNFYILNESAGNEDKDGIWWSNSYHRGSRKRKENYSTQKTTAPYSGGVEYELTHRWNTQRKEYEKILGIFTKKEYVPARCDAVDHTILHPLVNYGKDNSYCYRCTLRFDKNLKSEPARPGDVWLATRTSPNSRVHDESNTIIYTLLSASDQNLKGQTLNYIHTIEEGCRVIGLNTKWAYCRKHDYSWNDQHGRSVPKHTPEEKCEIGSPGSDYSYCRTHSVAIDRSGAIRDPKVQPSQRGAKKKRGKAGEQILSVVGTGSGSDSGKIRISFLDALEKNLFEDPDLAVECDYCKQLLSVKDAVEFGWCSECYGCFDCGEGPTSCMCYVKNKDKIQAEQAQTGY